MDVRASSLWLGNGAHFMRHTVAKQWRLRHGLNVDSAGQVQWTSARQIVWMPLPIASGY